MLKPRAHILSLGSVNIDIAAHTMRIPQPGETVHAKRYTIGLGGKGANQAAAAARLGQGCDLVVCMAGRTGADQFGTTARTALTQFGTDVTALVPDPNHPTGLALITVDNQGQNLITVTGGANMALTERDVTRHRELIHSASTLLLQLEIPLAVTLEAAKEARQQDTLVILDPAPAPENGLPKALWQTIDIITPNESETHRLTGIYPETRMQAIEAARILRRFGARHAVVKMGAHGVCWCSENEEGFVPPFPVNPIDTVAAGDCFNGGLATALTLEYPFGKAVHLAAACGALATTRLGAADAAPYWDEALALLKT